jgi:isopentenyl-diphosphate Delta-isomerase
MDQHVILVNQNDEILGIKEKLIAHKEGLLHRAFSIIVFNDYKELLLQRRALSKYHSAGLWTNTCCSHPNPEENIEDSIHKRLSFEMGFDCNLYFGFSFLYKIKFKNGLTENEFDHVYYGFYNDLPQINYNEVMDFRWASIDALKKEVAESPQNFTAWFPLILEKL